MPFKIEEFSSLFFKYCIGEDLGTEQSPVIPNLERFKKIMDKLYDMYKEDLKDDILKILKVQKFSCEACTKLILSKCVKLSKTPHYLRFMLVCAFLYGIIYERFTSTICPSLLANWTSRCLESVYYRCYMSYFRDKYDSEPLESYCIQLDTKLSKRRYPQDCRKLRIFDDDEINKSMSSSKEKSDYRSFQLKDSEVEMAREIAQGLSDDSFSELDYSSISLESFNTSDYSQNDSILEESVVTQEDEMSSIESEHDDDALNCSGEF